MGLCCPVSSWWGSVHSLCCEGYNRISPLLPRGVVAGMLAGQGGETDEMVHPSVGGPSALSYWGGTLGQAFRVLGKAKSV